MCWSKVMDLQSWSLTPQWHQSFFWTFADFFSTSFCQSHDRSWCHHLMDNTLEHLVRLHNGLCASMQSTTNSFVGLCHSLFSQLFLLSDSSIQLCWTCRTPFLVTQHHTQSASNPNLVWPMIKAETLHTLHWHLTNWIEVGVTSTSLIFPFSCGLSVVRFARTCTSNREHHCQTMILPKCGFVKVMILSFLKW